MTQPTELFMGSRIPYLVRKCEDASNPAERMAILAEIEIEVEAYAAKRRVEAIDECLKAVERVHDEADEWEWAVDLIESRLLELKKAKP